ncbi:MAG: DUF3604 domain-containing protein [Myxococcota bacterium]|nr:DUF3604 domain-containing protein [Myxococcota bacterium]
MVRLILVGLVVAFAAQAASASDEYSPYVGEDFPMQLLWGDTHVHSSFSMDANVMGNTRLDPGDAYRFARGETVTSNTQQEVRLDRPLDFLVVSDHAEYMGVLPRLRAEDPKFLADPDGRRIFDSLTGDNEAARAIMDELIGSLMTNEPIFDNAEARENIWGEITTLADRYNQPGVFTALIGFEWTSMPGGDNLHRVVVYRDSAERAGKMVPVSAFDGDRPEDLWAFMEKYESETDGQILAIPHNGNLSNGRMFGVEDSGGKAIGRSYAAARARWEPLVEVTQIKGDGETHPLLSPDDEFADFETWDAGNLALVGMIPKKPGMIRNEYARSALKSGLELGAKTGINPYKFGMIGSTDAHTSLATGAENNFWGKAVLVEPGEPRTNETFIKSSAGQEFDVIAWEQVASGYAGVWAKENTREAIFDAMRRREVYATTGSRMQVRFFGGWDFSPEDSLGPEAVLVGYRKGVPMGGDLPSAPKAGASGPGFLIMALKDPLGANLERVQVVKGWLDDGGQAQEKVFDVVVAEPASGTVDLEKASYENDVGSAQFAQVWLDPDFDPAQSAFYYARVIEIPTPRWTAYDAARLGTEIISGARLMVQDRAYTSPIWYTPR